MTLVQWDYRTHPFLPLRMRRATSIVLAGDLAAEPKGVREAVLRTMALAGRHRYDLGAGKSAELVAACVAAGVTLTGEE